MNKKLLAAGAAGLVVALAGLVPVHGAIVLNTPETFDADASATWTAAVAVNPNPGATVTPGGAAIAGANGGNAAKLVFPGGFPSAADQLFYSTSANFIGDYSSQGYYASFRYYADTADSSLAFYLHSGANAWKFNLATPVVGWNNYMVPISLTLSWYSTTAGPAPTLLDLAAIDQIGIWAYNSGISGVETYGLDDFGLGVPEPSTVAILAFAILTLALTLRHKRDFLQVSASVRVMNGR